MNIKKVIEIAIGVSAILGIGFLKLIAKSDGEKYTDRWFEIATDDELSKERENIRLKYLSSEIDSSQSTYHEHLLRKFDKVMNERAWGDKAPHPPTYRREHGYYLPNDD